MPVHPILTHTVKVNRLEPLIVLSDIYRAYIQLPDGTCNRTLKLAIGCLSLKEPWESSLLKFFMCTVLYLYTLLLKSRTQLWSGEFHVHPSLESAPADSHRTSSVQKMTPEITLSLYNSITGIRVRTHNWLSPPYLSHGHSLVSHRCWRESLWSGREAAKRWP